MFRLESAGFVVESERNPKVRKGRSLVGPFAHDIGDISESRPATELADQFFEHSAVADRLDFDVTVR